jgi:hypothetical protein
VGHGTRSTLADRESNDSSNDPITPARKILK